MPKPLISVIINTYNDAKYLSKCLKSVKNFADEIILIDMHSNDNSVEIAKSHNAKVFQHRYMKCVEPARNFALSKAKGKWILLLDPDEYITKTLKRELQKITNRTDVDFVRIPRKNIVFNKWMRHSGSWPDYLIRFFKKGAVKWNKEIHSQPETKGNGITILDTEKLAIRHNNYPTITSYLNRMLRYTKVQAEELISKQHKLKLSDFILKPTQEFNSRFFASQGYKDGIHGLVFALLQAFSECLIYIRIWEKRGFKEKNLPKESFVSASQQATYEYSHWFAKYFADEKAGNIFKSVFIKFRHLLNRLTKNF
ncbi:glycosyltransferase family 2 protein [Patescibacteria group bacterium]|nr:glycosyltransferase family 2 protein [Patescibacteria group bacterium]MCG2701950.1 glycosyltransferase family 2 protein [Candidatus Parcubacteria bacterium]MBU4265155.1 glycosyltransferase family 2 protein [Patescibacteria group bacterium]MBU4390719.1 glycosyltransferase family 2 protein [Patescibacteria group bacterium]MBU4397122.1 glycosyltransferase family 2 protein [Patescibacteria group bacterium]